eukprot:Em1141g2a
MVDLETAARSFQGCARCTGRCRVRYAAQDTPRFHQSGPSKAAEKDTPPRSTTVTRAPRVAVAHAVLSEQAPRLSSASDCSSLAPESPRSLRRLRLLLRLLRRRRRHGRRAPVLTRRLRVLLLLQDLILRGRRSQRGRMHPLSREEEMRHHFSGIERLRYPMRSTNSRACRYRSSWLSLEHPAPPPLPAASRTFLVGTSVPRRVRAAGPQSGREAGIPRRDAARLTSGMSLFRSGGTLLELPIALQNLTTGASAASSWCSRFADDVELANFCGNTSSPPPRPRREFREAFHDAVELGPSTPWATREDETGPSTRTAHHFRFATELWLPGSRSCSPCIGDCKGHTSGLPWVHRGDGGDRIVVEVVIRDVTSGTFLGLWSLPSAVWVSFQSKMLQALVIAKEEAVLLTSPVAIAGCLITNSTQFLNQSHLPYTPASFQVAGWGLMIRPCPNATIPRGAYYAILPLGKPPSTAPPSDYELSSTRRGSLLVYDPQFMMATTSVDSLTKVGSWRVSGAGSCIGQDRGCTAYSPTVAEAIFADRSCVEYHVANGGTHVVKYHRHIGHDSDLVKCVFWLLLSDKSTMPIQCSRRPALEQELAPFRFPIESAVAGASCTATIANCEPDVLASVSCLVFNSE